MKKLAIAILILTLALSISFAGLSQEKPGDSPAPKFVISLSLSFTDNSGGVTFSLVGDDFTNGSPSDPLPEPKTNQKKTLHYEVTGFFGLSAKITAGLDKTTPPSYDLKVGTGSDSGSGPITLGTKDKDLFTDISGLFHREGDLNLEYELVFNDVPEHDAGDNYTVVYTITET